jgi:hypothetical protein
MSTIDPYAIFVPTKELDADTAPLFAGRQETLLVALKSFSKPRSSVAFFGNRGVGKSSLGRILMGLLDGRIAPEAVGLTSDPTFTRRACIRINWTSGMQTLEHLLYQLFNPNLKDRLSFAQQFPSITVTYRSQFERIDLKELTAEGAASEARLGPNQVLVHDMVNTIEDAYFASTEISNTGAKNGLVIVIDEMDQAMARHQATGLGTLIKNSRFQFLTIGIGSAITDILDDHLSAERQFAGGQFEIEPLTRGEVRELFNKASKQAAAQGAAIRFGDGFCDLVAEDFFGYPAQIQAFGLDLVVHYQQRLEAGIEVKLRAPDYVPLLTLRETSPNRDIRAMNDVDAGVAGSVVRWEILKAILQIRDKENVRWITLDKLRKRLTAAYHVKLRQNLEGLVQSNTLEANDSPSTSVNIARPAVLIEIKRRIRQGWDPKARLNK